MLKIGKITLSVVIIPYYTCCITHSFIVRTGKTIEKSLRKAKGATIIVIMPASYRNELLRLMKTKGGICVVEKTNFQTRVLLAFVAATI